MNNHTNHFCPRCQKPFICKKENIEDCQCQNLVLSTDTLAFLKKTYFGCLCRECLIEIDRFIKSTKGQHFPEQKEDLIENLHYYKEGNNWVFTELYHYLRGYCCGNGCRHCVYGFSKSK